MIGFNFFGPIDEKALLAALPQEDEGDWVELFNICAEEDLVTCAAWLLQRKPSLVTADEGYNLCTALTLHATYGPEHRHEPKLIRLLLAAGADPNAGRDRHPLSLVPVGGGDSLMELLFEYGAVPPPGCSQAILLAYDYWREARARVRRVRIALWLSLGARGWPRDLARVFRFSHKDMEWRVE